MLILYHLIYHVTMILLTPFFAAKMLYLDKYKAGLKQRFGYLPEAIKSLVKQQRVIWVHGVSVGEIQAAFPLIKKLTQVYPHYKTVVTTTTKSGQEVAKKHLSEMGVMVFYFPLDFFWSVRRVIGAIQPKIVITLETEIWPAFLNECFRRKIPVLLLNGRISDKSLKGYTFAKPLFGPIFKKLSLILAQTEKDRERMISLGAPAEKSFTVGNLKFDVVAPEKNSISQKLEFLTKQPILMAGSTHRGEEKILLETYRRLKKKYPLLILFIAPRHPERLREVESLITEKNFSVVLKSKLKKSINNSDVILLDTMGELSSLYSLATVVFMGKSLVRGGGQNPLEPAAHGKPIVIGPHMENFDSICKELLKRNGIIQINSPKELYKILDELISSPNRRREIGENAKRAIIENRGATETALRHIDAFLLPYSSQTIGIDAGKANSDLSFRSKKR